MYTDNVNSAKRSVVDTEETTLLSRMVGGFEKHNAQICELTLKLNRTIDRLIGSEPPQADGQDEQKQAGSRGIAFELEGHLIRQEVLIGELESAIRRLSVL